jgi:hypothetical protein
MGHQGILSYTLRKLGVNGVPLGIAEIGAGDGNFLLGLARQLGAANGDGNTSRAVWLVDRQDSVPVEVRESFHKAGWHLNVVRADVFDWLAAASTPRVPVLIANLFLHHFTDQQLRDMFAGIALRTDLLMACEPSRSWPCVAGASLVGLIGCNRVTRHDAVISVRAGFRNSELSRLWPDQNGWYLEERRAGWASHLFVARRRTDA